ncbi:DUF2141 domain-containing protein [Caulobacter sp. X]|uniref:DUF2141 domain-containing protein n=1 Tax=Caulobacter sp. X TaxID=2048901 RepID=UPI000C14EB46|nr:DUF2141 domain-containing protein [Caulobacter sp. X]PIC00682.1 hypothetical protein CSW60_03740 [Caulobacter sp. X]
MKARSVLIGAIFATLAAGSASAEGLAAPLTDKDCVGRKGDVRLIVQVGALRSNAGEVSITVYPADPDRFLVPRGKLLRQRVKASAPMTQACFNLPVADAYAVEAYHDVDTDRELDRNPQGLPTEGYGFSNDAPTRYAKPSYDAVRFMVKPGDNTIRIKIRYPR